MRRYRRRVRCSFNPTSFAAKMRMLGATAHFDPSWGASDDGTTSTWVDRISGHTVASTSQATRMTYSASVSGLNNRPGFSGVAASSTKLLSADGVLAALLDDSAANSVYIVRKASSVAAASTSVCAGNTATGHLIKYGALITTGAQVYSRDGGSLVSSTGVVQDTTGAVVVSCVYSGSAVSAWSNAGPSVVAAAHVQAPTCDRFVIGALLSSGSYSEHFSGDIGDIIIFPTAHTAAEHRRIEQEIALKYGWPVLQGLSGFTAANHLANAGLTSGVRGDDTNGVWTDVLVRPDVLTAGTQYLYSTNTGVLGHAMITGTVFAMYAQNGTTFAYSPYYTPVAADVGKLQFFGGTAGPSNLVRGFRNSAEVGAGTALTGFAKSSTIAYSVGVRAAASPASSHSIFGISGGDVEQTLTNHQARAAAIKAARAFVTAGGATPTHGWAVDSDAATIPDIVGGDLLTRAGSLTLAQIIVPTWPW